MATTRINISIDAEILADLEDLKVKTGIPSRSKLLAIGVKLLKWRTNDMSRLLAEAGQENLTQGILSFLD